MTVKGSKYKVSLEDNKLFLHVYMIPFISVHDQSFISDYAMDS